MLYTVKSQKRLNAVSNRLLRAWHFYGVFSVCMIAKQPGHSIVMVQSNTSESIP